jgi:hypothetical protein
MSTRALAALLAALAVIVVCHVRSVQQNAPRLNVEVVEPERGAYVIRVHAVSPRFPDKKMQRSLDGEALVLAEAEVARLEKQWGRQALATPIVLCRVRHADGTVSLVPMEMLVIFIPPGRFPPPDPPVS